MNNLSRREVLIGTIAVAAAANFPAAPAVLVAPAPAEVIPAWVVGSEGEFNWQHIIAKTEREACRFFAQECGDYEDECDHDSYQDGCDCCEAIAAYDAERKPMWDGRPYDSISPGDWLRSGTGHVCSRCSYETFPEEGGHGVGDEAVCEECMTLADWDIIDPDRAAEIRADMAGRAAALRDCRPYIQSHTTESGTFSDLLKRIDAALSSIGGGKSWTDNTPPAEGCSIDDLAATIARYDYGNREISPDERKECQFLARAITRDFDVRRKP